MIAEQTTIATCIETLRKHPDISDKRTIAQTYKHLGNAVGSSLYFPDEPSKIVLGDDAAAIPQSDGSHLLFAAEGIITPFLNKDPWFAGYSAVMVNISDICAMGGLPVAVTDTLYVSDAEEASELWDGMLSAANAYGIPIVGGHTCYHSDHKALSVSVLGKATAHILTSFNAKPGEALVLAIDMNGTYYKNYAFWNASTTTSAKMLQENVRLPYEIANKKLSTSAKDISMGGIIGTLCMLLNTSGVGAEISLDHIKKPTHVSWEKWLSGFPSYGYLFTCNEKNTAAITSIFSDKGIQCNRIGTIIPQKELWITYKEEKIKF